MTTTNDGGRKLKVAVIGCGGIAQMMHLPHLAERPDRWEVVALADTSERTLEQVGARYPNALKTSDLRAAATRPEVDAVLVLHSGPHKSSVITALEAGKHVFVEKPLGYSLSETEAIARVAKASGKTLMVGYHKRFDPAVRRAAELVKSIEDLRYVEVTVLHPDETGYRGHHVIWPDPDAAKAPYREDEDRAGGLRAVTGPLAAQMDEVTDRDASGPHRLASKILTESLIHDMNLVRGILGEPEAVLHAHVWQEGMAQQSLTRFKGGVRANLSWVFVPGLRNYEETVRFIAPKMRVTLTFPSPYLRHFPTPLTVERMEGSDHVVEQRHVSYEEAFRAELEHFRRCLLEGKTPELTADEALGDAKWIQAIARAYRKAGDPVLVG